MKHKIIDIDSNPVLRLEVKYGNFENETTFLSTNYERELAYNIEHTIHHLAIIKIAFNEIYDYVNLPENFGIASSTVKFRKE